MNPLRILLISFLLSFIKPKIRLANTNNQLIKRLIITNYHPIMSEIKQNKPNLFRFQHR